jgi:hypothetical protein
MWKAKLTDINYDLAKTVDAFKIIVELFHDTDGRKVTKTYNLYLDEMADTNLTTIKAQVVEDLARLEKFDDVRELLETKIGKVI